MVQVYTYFPNCVCVCLFFCCEIANVAGSTSAIPYTYNTAEDYILSHTHQMPKLFKYKCQILIPLKRNTVMNIWVSKIQGIS